MEWSRVRINIIVFLSAIVDKKDSVLALWEQDALIIALINYQLLI